MTFSQETKKELMARISLPNECCVIAAAYGAACFGKYFDARGVVLHTEQAGIAQFVKKIFAQAGIAGKIYVKGNEENRIYEFAIKEPNEVEKMLALFGHDATAVNVRIRSENLKCEHCVNVFIALAFLCCGTMTNPEKEYNLEFLSSRHTLMKEFSDLLMGHGFSPKLTQRKGSNVLYLKASEQIEDLLTFMGASNATLQIASMKVYKDFRNKANRITNCETANIDKTVNASGKTVQAIAYLKQNNLLDSLPQALIEAAEKRIEYPDLPLKELAQKFSPVLSKSGLSHRMKKLEQLAQESKERKQNG